MGNTGSWVFAFVKKDTPATNWEAVAASLGALDGFLVRSDALPSGLPEGVEDLNIGQQAAGAEYWTNYQINGQVGEMALRFEGIERIMAQVAGDATAPTVVGGETIVYDHFLIAADSNIGQCGTLGRKTGVGNPMLFPSVRYTGFEIKNAAGLVVLTPNFIANKPDRTLGTTFDTVTVKATKLAALFNQMVFRLNDASDVALAAGDEFKVNDFTITYDRNQEASPVNRSDGTPDEPEAAGGAPTGTVRVVFPNLIAAQDFFHLDNLQVGVDEKKEYKADFGFTGPEVPASVGPVDYFFGMEFPKLVLRNYENPGPGPIAKIPVTVELGMLSPDSAPTGMTWATAGQVWRAQCTNLESATQASV